MYRTVSVRIKKGHKLYRYCAELCAESASLYNRANYLMRQHATAVRDLEEGKELKKNQEEAYLLIRRTTQGTKYEPKGKWLGYGQLDYILKMTADPAYFSLPAQANQQILKRVVRDYKAFFEALKKYEKSPASFTGRPRLPGYKKKGGTTTAVLTNQICRIKDGHYLKFPGTKTRLNFGRFREGGTLKEVRIKPEQETYRVEVVLEIADEEKKGKLSGMEPEKIAELFREAKDPEYRIVSIDPGVNNFCAVTNNFGEKPFLIKGGVIKSANRYYNKKLAEYRSEAERCNGKKQTRRIRKLTDKRNRILKDLMHKASRKITDWAAEHEADVVILGHNRFQKQRIRTGHVNNQTIVQIPHNVFAGMLRYKLEEEGILLVEQEESYTSKADFLAGDAIPVYGEEKEGEELRFSGVRTKRGLYRHEDGTLSNADINGAGNILRKVFPNVKGWDRGIVDMPYVVRIA